MKRGRVSLWEKQCKEPAEFSPSHLYKYKQVFSPGSLNAASAVQLQRSVPYEVLQSVSIQLFDIWKYVFIYIIIIYKYIYTTLII